MFAHHFLCIQPPRTQLSIYQKSDKETLKSVDPATFASDSLSSFFYNVKYFSFMLPFSLTIRVSCYIYRS